MMPSSRRVVPLVPKAGPDPGKTRQPRLQAIVTALSRANSSAIAVAIASTFLLLSTVLSFVPDRGSSGQDSGPPALGLRGTLDADAD